MTFDKDGTRQIIEVIQISEEGERNGNVVDGKMYWLD